MKKPLIASFAVNVAVTMPEVVTSWPGHGVAAPSPCRVWIGTGPLPSPHGLGGVQSFAAPGVSSPPTGSNAPISKVSSQRNAWPGTAEPSGPTVVAEYVNSTPAGGGFGARISATLSVIAVHGVTSSVPSSFVSRSALIAPVKPWTSMNVTLSVFSKFNVVRHEVGGAEHERRLRGDEEAVSGDRLPVQRRDALEDTGTRGRRAVADRDERVAVERRSRGTDELDVLVVVRRRLISPHFVDRDRSRDLGGERRTPDAEREQRERDKEGIPAAHADDPYPRT